MSKGGLAVPEVKLLIKACRVKLFEKLFRPGNESWKIIPQLYLKCLYSLDKISHFELKMTNVMKNYTGPDLYMEYRKAWNSIPSGSKVPEQKVVTIPELFNQDVNEIENRPNDVCIKVNDSWQHVAAMKLKDIYGVLTNKNAKTKCERHWEDMYRDLDWVEIYKVFEEKCIDRKILEFQWKCLSGAVMTEKKLQRMGYSNGVCCLCGAEEENLSHILLDCDTLGSFWNIVIDMVKVNCETYTFNEKDVMLVNCSQNNWERKIVNFLFLIAKWIVWKRRCVVKYENNWVDELSLIGQYKEVVKNTVNMGLLSKYKLNRDFFMTVL